MLPLANFFFAAASILEGGAVADPVARAEAERLVGALGDEIIDREAKLRLAHLLRVGTRLESFFQLSHARAPGLHLFGAQADPGTLIAEMVGEPMLNFGGAGTSLRSAFESCLGEAAEYLSQLSTGPASALRARCTELQHLPEAWREVLRRQVGEIPVDYVMAQPLGSAPYELPVPVDLCHRRPPARRDFAPGTPLSTGCAAGVTAAAARTRAILELVERDAVARWWRGGQRGRAIAIASHLTSATAQLLAQLASPDGGRHVFLLDITAGVALPVVAAMGFDGDGRGFACGLGAGLSTAAAAQSAVIELGQMEVALELARAKLRDKGEEALSAVDRNHLCRARSIDWRLTTTVQPSGWATPTDLGADLDNERREAYVIAAVQSAGLEPYVIDLTSLEIGVPVVRVVIPGLHPDPSEFDLSWLADLRRESGSPIHNGVPLLP